MDLAALAVDTTGLDAEGGAQGRGLVIADGEGPGHSRIVSHHVGGAQDLVERLGDDASVHTGGRSLVGIIEPGVPPYLPVPAVGPVDGPDVDRRGDGVEQPADGAVGEELLWWPGHVRRPTGVLAGEGLSFHRGGKGLEDLRRLGQDVVVKSSGDRHGDERAQSGSQSLPWARVGRLRVVGAHRRW